MPPCMWTVVHIDMLCRADTPLHHINFAKTLFGGNGLAGAVHHAMLRRTPDVPRGIQRFARPPRGAVGAWPPACEKYRKNSLFGERTTVVLFPGNAS
jgi:hypothetical protein